MPRRSRTRRIGKGFTTSQAFEKLKNELNQHLVVTLQQQNNDDGKEQQQSTSTTFTTSATTTTGEFSFSLSSISSFFSPILREMIPIPVFCFCTNPIFIFSSSLFLYYCFFFSSKSLLMKKLFEFILQNETIIH